MDTVVKIGAGQRGKTGGTRLTVGMKYDSASVAGSTPRTEMSDLLYQPDPRLLAEIEQLRELEKVSRGEHRTRKMTT
jgi:hypothetical protein